MGETESGGEPGGEKKRSVEWVLSSERSVGSGDGTGGRARGGAESARGAACGVSRGGRIRRASYLRDGGGERVDAGDQSSDRGSQAEDQHPSADYPGGEARARSAGRTRAEILVGSDGDPEAGIAEPVESRGAGYGAIGVGRGAAALLRAPRGHDWR